MLRFTGAGCPLLQVLRFTGAGCPLLQVLRFTGAGCPLLQVELLHKCMEVKGSIHKTKWECAAANLQRSHQEQLLSELQLLHVTKELQLIIKVSAAVKQNLPCWLLGHVMPCNHLSERDCVAVSCACIVVGKLTTRRLQDCSGAYAARLMGFLHRRRVLSTAHHLIPEHRHSCGIQGCKMYFGGGRGRQPVIVLCIFFIIIRVFNHRLL
jgi:hypothetical protein